MAWQTENRRPIRLFDCQPTPRTLCLLLLPIVFWSAAYWLPWLTVVGWLLLVTAVIILTQDIRHSLPPEGIEIERQHHRKLTIRDHNEISLQIVNHSNQPVTLELRDGIPATFQTTRADRNLQVTVNGRSPKRIAYQVRPTRRGEYQLGPIHARWPSRWGFFRQQRLLPVITLAKIYPNLLQLRLYDQLARQGNLASGLRLMRQAGDGSEFEQLRDYQPDDDFRRISWTATARHGKPITMDYSPERSQNVMVLLDTGRRMLSRPLGEARITRLDLIINAVLMFCYVALSRADRVGVLAFDREVRRYVPPRSGKGHFYQLVEALHDVEGTAVEPDYGLALRTLQANRHNRTLILLLTDPAGEEGSQSLLHHIAPFYPQHLPMCVVLSDPAVQDAAQRRPYNMGAIYQRAVAEQILTERQLWLSQLNQRGIKTLDVPAHQLTASVINAYLELKDRGQF